MGNADNLVNAAGLIPTNIQTELPGNNILNQMHLAIENFRDWQKSYVQLQMEVEGLRKDKSAMEYRITQQQSELYKLHCENTLLKKELTGYDSAKKNADLLATSKPSTSKVKTDVVTSSTKSPIKSPSSRNSEAGTKIVEAYSRRVMRTNDELGLVRPTSPKTPAITDHFTKIREKENVGGWLNTKRKSPNTSVRKCLTLSKNVPKTKQQPIDLITKPGCAAETKNDRRKIPRNDSFDDLFHEIKNKRQVLEEEAAAAKQDNTQGMNTAMLGIKQEAMTPPAKVHNDDSNSSDLFILPTQKDELIVIEDSNIAGLTQFLKDELERNTTLNNPHEEFRDDDQTYCSEIDQEMDEQTSIDEPYEQLEYEWACEKCKSQYENLYKDNHNMLLRLSEHCSRKHKRQPPVHNTPKGYWIPDFPPTQPDGI